MTEDSCTCLGHTAHLSLRIGRDGRSARCLAGAHALKNVRVGPKMWAVVAMSLAALLTYAAVSMTTVAKVRVGGDAYRRISQNNALLADVLPPPGYLVEADLTVYQLVEAAQLGDAAAFADSRADLDQLEADFATRHEYWNGLLTDPTLRTAMLDDAWVAGQDFFAIVHDEIIPALEAGDTDGAADTVHDELQAAFSRHRTAIDAVVEQTTASATEFEQQTISTAEGRGRLLIGLLGITLVVVLALSIGVVRSILRPVLTLRRRMAEIGSGHADLRARLDVDRRDEFGGVASSFNQFVDKLGETVGAVDIRAEQLLAGSRELTIVSEGLTSASTNSMRQTAVVAEAAEQVNRTMSSVLTASGEMQVAIDEIARSAADAAAVSGRAVGAADAADEIISRLGKSSQEINAVANMITSIAEQTNLLALNASIESARAGEAGKGFAVVASEVKELAQATARATGDIAARIERIQTDSAAAVGAIAEIRRVIVSVSDAQGIIASAVEEQTATTSEIARSIRSAATSAESITDAIADSVEAADRTTQGAQSTRTSAGRVADTARELKEIVGQFAH